MYKLLLTLALATGLLAETTILPYGIYPTDVGLPLTPKELRKTGYMVYTNVPDLQIKAVKFTLTRGTETYTQVVEPITTVNGRTAGAVFPIGITEDKPVVLTEELVVSKAEVTQ